MKQPHAPDLPDYQRREDAPAVQIAIETPSDEMVEAGAEFLYGKTRTVAIELQQENEFEACCDQARQILLAMLMAKAGATERQLAEGEPVNNPPLLW